MLDGALGALSISCRRREPHDVHAHERIVSCRVLDRAPQAFARLQRVRQQFPNTPEAATALQYSTILYRLYIRPPAQPAYAFSGRFIGAEGSRFGDVLGVTVDETGRILLGHKQGVSIFDEQGDALRQVGVYRAPHAHSVAVDPRTHRVYLPLQDVDGKPVLRILEATRI